MSKKTESFYEFAGFRLDVAKRILIRQGELITLAPKVFDTLLLLVQNSGRILEKDDLMQALWPDNVVEEGNLSQNIFVLRKVLGDDRTGNSLIQTIPRRGYRFVVSVRQINVSVPENGRPGSSQSSLVADYWNCHSPFRSLQVFEPEDAWLFFGREPEINELLERLARSSVLAVVGNSGCGKSSLIRAGLIPALQAGRFCQEGSEVERWRVTVFRPTEAPFDYLAEVLATQLAPELSLKEQAEFIADCRNKFPIDKNAVRNAVNALVNVTTKGSKAVRPHVLLVVDQFEEIFTLTNKRETRESYINALLAASQLGGAVTIHVVLTLRADFYAQCLEHPDLSRCLGTNQYNVPRMNREQLLESMERRLQLAAAQAEPGLVDSLLEEVGAEPGNLALLEHALGQLWERCGGFASTLTNKDYSALGRLRGALSAHADRVYSAISDGAQKHLTQKIFLELVQLGEGAPDTKRRVMKTDLLSLNLPEVVEHVLARLAFSRLISINGEGHEAFVEVSHEALIREWSTLRDWIAQNREELRLGRRLVQSAHEWSELNEDPAALLHGARLSQAEEWLTRHDGAPVLLHNFVQTSAAARSEAVQIDKASKARDYAERKALNLRLGWGFAAVFLMAATVVGAVFVNYTTITGTQSDGRGWAYLEGPYTASARNILWLITNVAIILLLFVVCLTVIKKGFYKSWKALSFFMFSEVLQNVVLFTTYLLARSIIPFVYYYYCFYIFAVAEIVFKSFVVLELLIKILDPFEALSGRTIAWFCFWAVQYMSVTVAIYARHPSGQPTSLILLIQTTTFLANGMLLLVVLFQAKRLKIIWRSAVAQFAASFCLFNIFLGISRIFIPADRLFEASVYVVVLFAWIWILFHCDPVPPLRSAPKKESR